MNIELEKTKAAIERAEQNLAYFRMTRRDDGYITMRPSDLEIFVHLARLATSPEMTAMREASARLAAIAPNFGSNDALIPFDAALALGRAEVTACPDCRLVPCGCPPKCIHGVFIFGDRIKCAECDERAKELKNEC